jgi:hypothetical protein
MQIDRNGQGFKTASPDILVVDDFLNDPDGVVEFTKELDYAENLAEYKGKRSTTRHLWDYLREEFGRLLGRQVVNWTEHGYNGVFQRTWAGDPLVFHSDLQGYAGAIYLSTDFEGGTSFWRHKTSGVRHVAPGDFEDKSKYFLVDTVAGVYNRLVIWNGSLIHSAENYPANGERLVQLFFFDVL